MATHTVDPAVEEIVSEEEDAMAALAIYRIGAYPSDPTLEVLYQRWQRGEIEIP